MAGCAVAHAQAPAGRRERARRVGRAIVGHDPLYADAADPIVLHPLLQERHGALLALVRGHGHPRHPRMVVDGDMGELPADAAHPVPAIARYPMAGSLDPAQRLGIDVDQLARRGTLASSAGACGSNSRQRLRPAWRSTRDTRAADAPAPGRSAFLSAVADAAPRSAPCAGARSPVDSNAAGCCDPAGCVFGDISFALRPEGDNLLEPHTWSLRFCRYQATAPSSPSCPCSTRHTGTRSSCSVITPLLR